MWHSKALIIWCLVWEQCPTAIKEWPVPAVPSTWETEADDDDFESQPLWSSETSELRKDEECGGGGGEFACLKSEDHVYLVTVFCCHTLYSAHLDVCDYGHLWLQEASRLCGSSEWGCEGQTTTWRMASKASCCMRIYWWWCCSLPWCRGSKWHRGWVYAILRETHLSLNSLLLG